ncbi:MAG: hypothetical protein QGG40_12925 [Myxococcota bacterium]|jgi:hypothetical protein|nr:hypothetical protein [Myxococcota bacterium]
MSTTSGQGRRIGPTDESSRLILGMLPRVTLPPARVVAPGAPAGLVQALSQRGYRSIRVETKWDDDSPTSELVVECGSFAQLDPASRSAWTDWVTRVVLPGGYLFGIFPHFDGGGPPYGTSEGELRSRLRSRFEEVLLAPSPGTDPDTGWPWLRAIYQRRTTSA